MEQAQAIITITISQDEHGNLTSTHKLENVDDFIAALILLDVGRDLLRDHYEQHQEQQQEK